MKARAKVLRAFRYVPTGQIWLVGETFEGDGGAVASLAGQGFLEAQAACARPAPEAPDPEAGGGHSGWDGMTVAQLARECESRGIAVPKKPRKAELVAALESSEEGE